MHPPTPSSPHPLPSALPPPPPPSPPSFPTLLSEDDKDRINTWFDHDSRLPEIAKELDTNVLDLATWADQPHIKQALEFVKRIARERVETLQAEADHQSISRLLSLARYSEHEETARRACINLLMWHRVLQPQPTRRPPGATTQPEPPPQPPSSPPNPPRAHVPGPTVHLPTLRLPSVPSCPTGHQPRTPAKPSPDATHSALSPSPRPLTNRPPERASAVAPPPRNAPDSVPAPYPQPEPSALTPRTTFTPRPDAALCPDPCHQPRPPDQ